MQDNIVQITPNDVGANKSLLSNLDPKVLQLINGLANKPLLIEKLVLNQSQGVLLKLLSENQQLSLQLPIKTAELFKNTDQISMKLSLTVKQQVLLQVSQSDSTNKNNLLVKTVIFLSSKLLPNQILKLDNPNLKVAPSQNPARSISTPGLPGNLELPPNSNLSQNSNPKLIQKSEVLDKAPFEKVGQNPQHLQKRPIQPSSLQASIANHKNTGFIVSSGKTGSSTSPLGNPQSVLPSKLLAASDVKLLGENQITVANVAKQLLKSYFSKQLPIAKHLITLSKAAENLTRNLIIPPSPEPLVIKLQEQLKQLLAVIQKPVKTDGVEIKQRVKNSGHLLERNLDKSLFKLADPTQLLEKTGAKKLLNNSVKPELLMNKSKMLADKADQHSPVPNETKKTSTDPLQSNDIKLHLMKIRATLENIIKQNKPSQSEQNKPQVPTLPVSPTKSEVKLVASETALPTTGKLPNQLNQQLVNQQQMIIKQASELLIEVKNIVSQIESNQLLSLKNETPNLHQFLVDLPLKNNADIDSFEMLFEHSDINKSGRSIKHWKVVVRFDLEPLGPMFARVELENDRISTHFFSQSQQTAQLINQHLHILKKSLFSAGVNIDKLDGSQGKIPERLIKINEQMIDTHA